MLVNGAHPESDEWSEWLLHRRHADDATFEILVRTAIQSIADRVIDGALLSPGMCIADVGTGDGLIGFAAIDRIGPSIHVMFADVSLQMLRHAESIAISRGARDQCAFLCCSAEKLDGFEDASVDVVCTRAALAYVADKPAALREFHRVLKPGGRLSIGEPIFRDDALEAISLKVILDSNSASDLDPLIPLLHRWKSAQFPDTVEKMAQSPIANFSERDLVRLIANSGFAQIQLNFRMDVMPSTIPSWEAFLRSSPHPWAPSVETILAEQFSLQERELFERALRPMIEKRLMLSSERIAFVTANKPVK